MTIGVLSWGAQKTLRNTLESYDKFKLDDTEKLIFFQEISKEDIRIAEDYGYIWIGETVNSGISGGYQALVEHTTGDLFLFLENDWELIENPLQQMAEARKMLEEGTIDIARFRHRKNHGWPLWSKQFEGNELSRPEFLLDSVYWSEPEFPEISKIGTWYTTFARFANWTNNPHMAKTEFLRKNILPRLEGDIEKILQPWWEQQEFIVAQSDGLFTHSRKD